MTQLLRHHASLLACFLLSLPLLAQPADGKLHATVEIGAYGSTSDRTPFWQRTNTWGTSPLSTPAGQLRAGVFRDYHPADTLRSRHRFSWGFGVEAVGNLNQDQTRFGQQQVLLPEAYAKIRFGRIEVWGGRRRQVLGLVDTLLSSGSYSVSNNALPMPQIQIAIPDYIPVGFLGKAVAFKGQLAHAWFNVPYVQNAYMHQKALFLRFGKPQSKLHGILGISHMVQWGGYAPYLVGTPYAVNGYLPSDFGDFVKSVFLGFLPNDWDNSRYTSFDGANRIGNHVGSIDLGFSLKRPNANWLLYLQHPYDDASGLVWINAPDGLYGLRWQRAKPVSTAGRFWVWQRVVGEFLATTNQSGDEFNVPGQYYKGADNYYNHGQYIEGYSYFRRTIGTPFIIPGRDIVQPNSATAFYPNNRLIAIYGAFEAIVAGRATVQGRLSYSRNYGLFSVPYPTVFGQFSGMLQGRVPLTRTGHTSLTASVAVDQGKLLTNAVGGYVGIRKTW